MGTCATIIVKTEFDGIRAITVNFDGYPDHTGKILKEHYTTQDKIDKLMALGDLSSIDEYCSAPSGHTYDNPAKGYCVAYGRDRGETDVRARTYKTIIEAKKEENDGSYVYIWRGKKWARR